MQTKIHENTLSTKTLYEGGAKKGLERKTAHDFATIYIRNQ